MKQSEGTPGARGSVIAKNRRTRPLPNTLPPHCRMARGCQSLHGSGTGRETMAEAGYMLPDLPYPPRPQKTGDRPEHCTSPSLTERTATEGTQTREASSLFRSPPRSASRYAGKVGASHADEPEAADLPATRFPYSFFPAAFRCPVPVNNRACGLLAGLVLLSVGGCASVQGQYEKRMEWEAGFVVSDDLPVAEVALVVDETKVSEVAGDAPKSVSAYDVDPVELHTPIRLAMVGVSGDAVLRRLAENTNLQWVSDTSIMAASSFDLDITIRDTEDMVALVDALALSAGARTQWDGARVTFTAEVGGTRGQSDGYLIRGAVRSPELVALVSDRYGVVCTNAGNLALCVGPRQQLSGVRSMLAALEGQYGRVAWRTVYSAMPVKDILVGLGLENDVTAIELGKDRYLLASSSQKMLDIAGEALKGAGGAGCRPFVFTPENVPADDIVSALTAFGVGFCQGPAVVGKSVYGNIPQEIESNVKAAAAVADRHKPLADLTVYVLTESDVKRAGIETSGWDGLIPTSNPVDAVSLSMAMQRSAGWRSVEIVTDGTSEAAIQQTDRVQGDVVITDGGSRISGVEERKVGLTVSLEGVITPLGFRGRISVNDSALNEDIVTTARCEGFMAVDVGQIAQVCSYNRDSSLNGIKLLGINGARNAEKFVVIVALNKTERAAIETLKMGVR